MPPRLRIPIIIGAVGIFFLGFVGTWSVFLSRPEASADAGARGAKGYREIARQVLQHLPHGAVLGAMQSGALSYYGQGVRVVNLDGVVNSRAYRASQRHALGRYMAEENIGHFADWRLNVEMLGYFYGDTWRPALLEPIFSASAQGDDRTTLYVLNQAGPQAEGQR